MDYAISEIALIAGAAFLASLISGLGGFGGGFIVVIALAPIIGAKAVVPVLSVFSIWSNVARIVFYGRSAQWGLAIRFILASLPGVFLGAKFLAEVPERGFLAFIGGVLIVAVPVRRYLKRHKLEPGLKTIVVAGLIFGFVSGAAAGSGMLVIATLTTLGLQGPVLLGTDAVIGLINSLTRAGTYWTLDLLTPKLATIGALMGLATFPGAWLASLAVRRMGVKLHTLLIEALIVCGGLFFVVKAVAGNVW
ncbi:MAG: sulfite exporter TauE/SafE family protein [Rhodospirillaceae bacterium]